LPLLATHLSGKSSNSPAPTAASKSELLLQGITLLAHLQSKPLGPCRERFTSSLDEIIIRKEAERRTEGEFWWGFGSTIRFARQREIRPPAKAKACDVCANAAFCISTLHRRCLYDVI
jgi:hypothetical protein